MSHSTGWAGPSHVPSTDGAARAARVPAAERTVRGLLESVDVGVDGGRPWDLRVHDPRLFERLLAGGSLALGESYMDGWWDCERLDELIERLLGGGIEERVRASARALWVALRSRLVNVQRGQRAFTVARRHYDLGNDFFRRMLDRRLTYSCGYWRQAGDLDAAQEAKLDLICRKIGLEPGQTVLDIGCGWGSFAGFAAERYGACVVGVTVSREQARYAQARYGGLPVEVRVQDYRDVEGTFDHIVSVGMFEHVGHRNYRTYMETAERCLRPDGRFLLHTIGRNRTGADIDTWIEKYIFPNSMLPSARQITDAAEGLFVLRDWHTFGADYVPTLMAWLGNCERLWDAGGGPREERFRRMWRYYLLASAGGFRADHCQLWQVLFSKRGCPGMPAAVR
ncbi:MAG TPA: cyclopropane fatty acyl phospholipid synthase [bacterium]